MRGERFANPFSLDLRVCGWPPKRVSNWVIALGIAETVFLFLAAVGLIGFSWLYAERERAKASWVCLIAVGLVACIVANDLL